MTDEPVSDVTRAKRQAKSTAATIPDLSGIEFPIEVGQIAKNKQEIVIVQFAPWGGSLLLNARIWYRTKDGVLRPTKDGWAVQAALSDEVFDVFAKARKIAFTHGWLKKNEEAE